MLINIGKSLYVGIENPRVTGSIPVQATKIKKPQLRNGAEAFLCLSKGLPD